MPSPSSAATAAISADARAFALVATFVLGLVLAALVLRRVRQPPTLYVHPVSAPARACASLVRAAGISATALELKPIALERGEHKSPEFKAINANGSVPALQDGELRIGESHAIMRYMCTRFALSDHWYPSDPQARARVDEYLDWHHTHSRKGVPYFFHKYIIAKFFDGAPDRLRMDEGKKAYLSALRHLDAHNLARTAFVAADFITIADLACYAEVGPMQWDKELRDQIRVLPNVSRWMSVMRLQPWHDDVHGSVRRVVEDASAKGDAAAAAEAAAAAGAVEAAPKP